jgi:hypothetical protein
MHVCATQLIAHNNRQLTSLQKPLMIMPTAASASTPRDWK